MNFAKQQLKSDVLKKLFIILAPIGFWYVSLFPAVLTPDSYAVIGYIRSGSLSGFHTILYELFVKILSVNGEAIYLVSLVQILLNYYALFITTRFILNYWIKSDLNPLIMTSALFFTPFFGPISMTIWKDNPHNAFVIIGAVKLLELFVSGQFIKAQALKISVLICTISLGVMFRHEAPPAFFILSLILFLLSFILKFFNGKILLVSAVVSLIVTMISFSGNQLAQVILYTKPVPAYQRTLSLLLDLEYTNSRYPSTLEERSRKILSEISSGSSLAGAGECNNPYNFWNPGFDEKAANRYASQIPMIWISSMKSNARDTVLSARFCRTAAVHLWPFSKTPTSGYWPTTGIWPNELGFENPRLTFPMYTLAFAWSYIWGINGNVIAWPGLHLSLLVLLGIILIRRPQVASGPKIAVLVVISYFLSRGAILFLTTASQEFRYMSGIYFFTAPILSAIALKALRRVKNP